MTKLRLLSSTLIAASFVMAGCQHQDAAPPPLASATPPPPVTGRPLDPPPPFLLNGDSGGPPTSGPNPHSGPGPHGGPPHWHQSGGDESVHVYRFDFVLTPKDPKDATLTPTSFSLNIVEGQDGEVMIGKNVPLGGGTPLPIAGEKGAPPTHLASARQDVGLKVKAHPRMIAGSEDLLVDIGLELSTLEGGGAVRKITAHSDVVATPGKSALVVSLDDDKRHYELSVTPTKLR